MPDLNQLRSDQEDAEQWLTGEAPDIDLPLVVEGLSVAAQSLLEAPEVWWCEEHDSPVVHGRYDLTVEELDELNVVVDRPVRGGMVMGPNFAAWFGSVSSQWRKETQEDEDETAARCLSRPRSERLET